MAIERLWESVSPVAFTADGGADGTITLSSTAGFKVKQSVVISAIALPALKLEVKRVTSPTQLIVGPVVTTGKLLAKQDLSAYTLGTIPTIRAEEQSKTGFLLNDMIQAVYEQEPTIAIRTVSVDQYGRKYGVLNPRPTSTYFNRNGLPQEVTEDTVDPSNNRPLPVKMTGFDGDVIINSENLNLETQLDGIYDAAGNAVPDTVGDIAHVRSISTDKTHLTQRVTAKRGTLDTDTVSKDVSLHDQDGNSYTTINPVPVASTYEKFFQLINASKWMELANYDQVTPTFDVNDLTLTYYEEDALLGEAVVTNYTSLNSWNLELKRYLDDDDGSPLQDDDGTNLNLD